MNGKSFSMRSFLLDQARLSITDIEKHRLLKRLIEKFDHDVTIKLTDSEISVASSEERIAVVTNAKRELYKLDMFLSNIH